MARYTYLVIQDETTWPVKDRNDVQRHVLGVHASSKDAWKHLATCVLSRKAQLFKEVRSTEFEYIKSDPCQTKVFECYLSNDDKSITCSFEIHKYRLHQLTKHTNEND